MRSLRARGPFYSHIFYYDLIFEPENLFLFKGWRVEGGRFPTFMVFNFLENSMVYTWNI